MEQENDTIRNEGEGVSVLQPRDSQLKLIDQNLSAEAVYQLLLAQYDYKMSEELHTYLFPILMGVGVISNLLTVMVLRRGRLRKSSVCFYLAVYGSFNFLNLAVVSWPEWTCYILEKPCIGRLANWSCGLWSFVTHVIVYGGIWIVVAMSIDRFAYLCLPDKASSLVTVFSAKIIVVFILVGLIVISVHAMWTFELQPQGCYIAYHQKDLHTLIWPWISATCFSYMPLALLFIFNLCISISLCLKRYRCSQVPVSRENSENDTHNYTALVVAMLFFVLNMPATIINIIDIHFPSNQLSVELVAQIELTKIISEVLTKINLIGLGYVLLLFSKAFRKEALLALKALRCRGTRKNYELREISKKSSDQMERKHVDYEICNTDNNVLTTNL